MIVGPLARDVLVKVGLEFLDFVARDALGKVGLEFPEFVARNKLGETGLEFLEFFLVAREATNNQVPITPDLC